MNKCKGYSKMWFLVLLLAAFMAGCASNETETGNSAKAITSYSIGEVAGIVNETQKTISATMPYGTSVTALAATFTTTGTSVKVGTTTQTSAATLNDFTSPVAYIVTAADGTTSTYTVTVTVASISDKAITSYSLDGVTGTINETAKTIAVTMPFGTNPDGLIATFTSTGTGPVTVDGVTQASGTAGTPNNFTNPVLYTVTAADLTTATYTVTVTVAASSAKAITAYSLAGVTGTINETAKTIAVTMPFGTNVTALTATYSATATDVKVAGVAQSSGTGTHDFTNLVVYTVTATDTSTATYTVIVTAAPSTAKAITSYSIDGVVGTIIGQAIAVTMPFGTDPTGAGAAPMVATYTTTRASVLVSTAPAIPVTTVTSPAPSRDFTTAATYRVTAADASFVDYTVTVTVASNSAKALGPYSIDGVIGAVNETAKTIAVTMPFGTDPTGTGAAPMVATFSTTGASVMVSTAPAIPVTTVTSPAPSRDFTTAATYRVTAADASFVDYTVTVTVAASTATPGPAGAAPDLLTAAPFGIVAWDAITNSAGPSHIYGDVALTQPGPGGTIASVTGPGFNDGGPAGMYTSSGVTNSDGTNPGVVTAADNGTPANIAALPQLLLDLKAVFDDLMLRPAGPTALTTPASASAPGVDGGTFAAATDLSGYVLRPGVYDTAASYGLSNTLGPLVLDAEGNADAVFVIRSTNAVTGITSTTGSVLLQNGAQAKNVFWVLEDATIGGGTFFQGTVVAGHTITLLGFANVEGRMWAGVRGLASGAITLTSTNTITVPQ
ncbi:MAG: ice-binding family protein [Syntrophales bacterium]|nr:ice-binding family protein [Syntrophales bacterium]